MARRSQLRASDADREYVAERLRNAAAEGRLDADEFENRLEAAFRGRTYGDLSAIVADLPPDSAVAPHRFRFPARLRPATVVALVLAFPIALAIAAAAIVAIIALLVAWSIAVSVAALVLGPRARALRGPWAVGCRALSSRRHQRGLAGSFTPWL